MQLTLFVSTEILHAVSLSNALVSMFNFLRRPVKYDPLRYWNERENPNAASGEARDRVDSDVIFISRHLAGAKRIFELGPGVGRTFDAYPKGSTVHTLDISRRYTDTLNTAASARGVQVVQSYLDGLMDSFPFEDGAFEVGVCCQVMLHQPPEVFKHSIAEMSRICVQLIIVSGFHSTFPDVATMAIQADHVFSHDYIHTLQNLDRRIDEIRSEHGLLYAKVV